MMSTGVLETCREF